MDADRTVQSTEDKGEEAKKKIAEAMLKAKMKGPRPVQEYVPPNQVMTVRS